MSNVIPLAAKNPPNPLRAENLPVRPRLEPNVEKTWRPSPDAARALMRVVNRLREER